MKKFIEASPEGFVKCSVEGCDAPKHRSCKYCCSHSYRLRTYGDVNGGTRDRLGSVQKYFRDMVLQYKGNDCLIWENATNGGGYAQVAVSGRMKDAHRIVCEYTNGPPPTPSHEAAHSCGQKACVTPSHLSWKTPMENTADKFVHGTIAYGELHANAKITWDDVRTIRANEASLTTGELARSFGLSETQILRIKNNKRWVEAA